MSGPLFDVKVTGQLARTNRVDEARAQADRWDHAAIAADKPKGQDLVNEVFRRGLAASISGLQAQKKTIKTELAAEMAAVKKQDPRTVPAITNAHVAQKRADLLLRASGEDPAKVEGEDGTS